MRRSTPVIPLADAGNLGLIPYLDTFIPCLLVQPVIQVLSPGDGHCTICPLWLRPQGVEHKAQEIIRGNQNLFGDGAEFLLDDGLSHRAHDLSDALAPFIIYHVKRLGLDYGEAAPAMVQVGNKEMLFEAWMLQRDDIRLAGGTGDFDKATPLLSHLKERGHALGGVAIIDDSAVNIERLLLPILQAGGIAIGYNPTEAHRRIFRKYSIPILKGLDLRAFAEIVIDRGKIREYCE